MHYQEYIDTHQKGMSITKKGERMFVVLISMAYVHSTQNVHTEATAQVYAEVLLAGSGKFSREQFLDEVHKLGASISVSAQNGTITISLSCLDTNHKKLLDIVTTMLHKPTFNPKEIKRVVQHVCDGLRESQEDAKTRSVEAFTNALYTKADYRYCFTTPELISAILKVSKRELEVFHKTRLKNFWTCTYACDERFQKTTQNFLKVAQAPFVNSQLPQSLQIQPKPTHTKVVTQNNVVLTSVPSKQNLEINIGSTLPFTQEDDEYFDFVFGLNVLGKWGGFAGRLMSTVREKEGLTYGIYAKTETTSKETAGYWRIMTFFSPEKVMQGIASTLREIELIKNKGISESEFNRFKTILNTQEVLLQDSLLKNVSNIHALQIKGFSYKEMAERKQKMHSVTRINVNKALKKYLGSSKLVFSIAGPVLLKKKELKALETQRK